MRFFKDIYFVTSYSLLIAQAGFIFILIYTKIMYQQVFYYGDTSEPWLISETYFKVLKSLLYTTIILIAAWAILTPFVVIYNRRNDTKNYKDVMIGALGFVIAIILLFIDPFGLLKWITIPI